MDHAALLRDVRHHKRRFAALCYRLQESRLRCVGLCADLAARHRAILGAAPETVLPGAGSPLYTFVRGSAGALRMVRRPRIAGGDDREILRCWTDTASDFAVVHVEGEVDLATAPVLAGAIAEAFRRRDRVIVDVAGVTYMDGSGIRVLAHAVGNNGTHLAVAGPTPRLRRIFDIVHTGDVIPLVASVEAGQEYLSLRH